MPPPWRRAWYTLTLAARQSDVGRVPSSATNPPILPLDFRVWNSLPPDPQTARFVLQPIQTSSSSSSSSSSYTLFKQVVAATQTTKAVAEVVFLWDQSCPWIGLDRVLKIGPADNSKWDHSLTALSYLTTYLNHFCASVGGAHPAFWDQCHSAELYCVPQSERR